MSSIYKNGNKWYYQNSINIDGRKQRFQRSLGTDDKDVATKLQMHYDYIIEYEKRNPFEEKREYLSQFITQYLEYREKQVKRRLIAPRTYDSDKGALLNFQRYIKHRFGDIKIKRLHRKDFEDFKEYRLDKDGISITTLGINLRHLKSFFSHLVRQEYIEKNPMKSIKIDSGERREFVPLNDEWKLLHNFLADKMNEKEYNWFYTMIWILVNTGMRLGELRILKWNQGPDDYGRKLAKQYVYLSPDCSKITIYYKRSLRTIPTHHIKDVFDKIPRTHLLYKHRKRKKEIEFNYVFENPVGQIPHHHSHITRQFKLMMKELGLNENYTPHSLRHGFVSYLLNSGEPIYNVSKIVGHSATQITEFIYAHHVVDNLIKSMSKLQQLTETSENEIF